MEHQELNALLAGLAQREERVVEMQSALTACKTLGPDNGGQGELVKVRLITDWLEACGVRDLQRLDAPDERVPDGLRPNLAARLPGATSRTLWLFGHTDVVPPGDPAAWTSDPWQVRREGDWLYGRGVEDNQQAIVSMLLLAEELCRQEVTPALSLGLVFMADEESGSQYGLAHVLEQAAQMFRPDDLYIVPDAGSPRGDLIEVAEKSQLWLKVRTTGLQCHASTPHKGRNAFVAGADMVLTCRQGLHDAFPQENALFRPPCSTFVPSRHEANVPSVNILPGSDVFYLDCRLLPDVPQEAVLAEARRLAAAVAARHGVEIMVEVEHAQPASATPANSPVVRALEWAVERVYGAQARPVGIGGATVAALLRRKGLPAAVWACIQNTCHQPDERASISAACKDAQVFAHILMQGDVHA
ncbi:M20 family metallo-hydrolase [uncultured Desulfovibrio sp.]|uniref:M20 family metallo-hydrolase n=1 Tax=uncultured Desulfovibrio sp. TaxID=167968 RepID=UPI0027121CDA|nr:M20 family metallo-hydrolase [uncultured Desulfovibrio sp.]